MNEIVVGTPFSLYRSADIGTTWSTGDFNYDGNTNASDFGLLRKDFAYDMYGPMYARTLQPAGLTIAPVEGQDFTGTAATFLDTIGVSASPPPGASDYLAFIDWGDGNFDAAAVTATATPGVFDISGTSPFPLANPDALITAMVEYAPGSAFAGRPASLSAPIDITPAVSGLSAAVSSGEIDLGWTLSATNASAINVYRSMNATSGFALIGSTTSGSAISYADTDPSLLEDTQYYYQVCAAQPGGPSGFSNVASATTLFAGPAGLTATPASTTAINLAWAQNVADATILSIYRSVDGGSYSLLTDSDVSSTLTAASLSFTDGSVSEGHDYSYKLQASGPFGTSAFSDPADASTLPIQSLDYAPTTTSQVLTWTNISTVATAINVYRSTDDATFTLLTTMALSGSAVTYTDSSASENTEYWYKVAITEPGGTTTTDPLDTWTLPNAPTTPTITSDTPTEVDLSWSSNSGSSTVFDIEPSDDDGADFASVGTTAAGATTFSDTTVVDSASYIYEIAAMSGDFSAENPSSATDVTTPALAPALTVTGSSSIATGSTFTLDFSAAYAGGGPGITGWTVNWGDGTPEQTFASTITSATHTFTAGLESATVIATTQDANGSYQSDPLTVSITGVSTPSAPSAVTAMPYSSGEIDVSWTPGSADATSFDVQRSSDGGSTWQDMGTVSDGSNAFFDTSVTGGLTYQYSVTATNDAGTSGSTASASVQAAGYPAVTATASADYSITVAWTYDGQDAAGFELEMSEGGIDNYHLVLTPGAGDGSHTFENLDPRYTYNFRIRVDHLDGTVSDYSESTSAVIPTNFPELTMGMYESDVEPTYATGNMRAFDLDYDDPITYSEVGYPEGGTLDLNSTTGAYTFNFTSGSDTGFFVCKATDQFGVSNLISMNTYDSSAAGSYFNVGSRTTPITVNRDQTYVSDDGSNLLAGITGPNGDPLVVTQVTADPGNLHASGHDITVNSDGSFSYTPPSGFVGQDWFTYFLTDTVTGVSTNYGSVFFNVVQVAPTGAPTAPTKLNAVLIAPNQVQLNWTNQSDNEADFVVQRATNSSFTTGFTQLDGEFFDTTAELDTLPNTTTKYYYRVCATNDSGNSAWSATVDQTGVALYSATFSGSGYQKIRRDSGTFYDTPQWVDNHLADGILTPTDPYPFPISYVRSTAGSASLITVSTTFQCGSKAPGAEWLVRGTGVVEDDVTTLTFDPVAVSAGADPTATMTCKVPLPSVIRSADLSILWEMSFDNGKTWYDVNTTTNHIYVTGVKVAPNDAFETVLLIGCEAANGLRPHNANESGPTAKTADKQVLDAIWTAFGTRAVYRADGALMVYSHTKGFADYAPEMLAQAVPKGQCTAWVDLLIRVLRAQGILAIPKRIQSTPGATFDRFRVKRMPAQGSGTANYTFSTDFYFHELVAVPSLYPNLLYDPSYGTTAESLMVWQQLNVINFRLKKNSLWLVNPELQKVLSKLHLGFFAEPAGSPL